MNFQTAVKTCLTEKYATFSGRASRPEYWWFFLAYFIGAVIAVVLPIPFLGYVYVLGMIVPVAAAGYRRLQDTGRPGWYIFVLIGLSVVVQLLTPAPDTMMQGGGPMSPDEMARMGRGFGLAGLLGLAQFVVSLVFLWWLTRPSQPGPNQYGPPPAR